MLQITRNDGRVTHIGIAVEKGFMLNILNKTDKNVVKVERGILTINQKEETRTFEVESVIYQSKNHETMELATKAIRVAQQKDAENEALRAQIEALTGEGGLNKVNLLQEEVNLNKQLAVQLGNAKNEAEAKAEAIQKENAKLKAELEALKKKEAKN